MHRCPETASSASILHSLSLPADEQGLAGHYLHSLLPPLHCQEECHATDGMLFAQVNPDRAGFVHAPESLTTIERNHLSCACMGLLVYCSMVTKANLVAQMLPVSCNPAQHAAYWNRHTVFARAVGFCKRPRVLTNPQAHKPTGVV